MITRDALPDDAPALAALFAELGYPDEAEGVARRSARLQADPASRLLVADDDGAVVGLAAASVIPLAQEDGDWCRLSALVVARRGRRSGAGSALVEAVERFARERRCRYVEVTSGERAEREVARRFYEALGYEPVSRRFLKEL